MLVPARELLVNFCAMEVEPPPVLCNPERTQGPFHRTHFREHFS